MLEAGETDGAEGESLALFQGPELGPAAISGDYRGSDTPSSLHRHCTHMDRLTHTHAHVHKNMSFLKK